MASRDIPRWIIKERIRFIFLSRLLAVGKFRGNDGIPIQTAKDEVASLLTSLGRNSSPEEVEKLITECDNDNSGAIDINEFITYMDKNYVVSKNIIEEVVDAFKIFDLDKSVFFIKQTCLKEEVTGFLKRRDI